MPIRRWLLLLLLLAAFLGPQAGCQPAPPVAATSVDTQPAQAKIDSRPADSAAASDPLEGPRDGQTIEESWDAYSMQGVRVGYAYTRISSVQEEGRDLIRTYNVTRTRMQRGGQAMQQEVVLTSWDTPAGELVRFASRNATGSGDTTVVGAVRDGRLGMDITTVGRTQSQHLAWQAGWGGLFAPDQSLRKQPLKPGEKRTIMSLLPLLNIVSPTQLQALEHEQVALPAGKARLLRVTSTVEVGSQKLESVLWTDEQGHTLKTLVPSLGLEAVRTTKALALEQPTAPAFDLQVRSSVPLRGNKSLSGQTRRAVYRARLKEGQIAGLFSDCPGQRVRLIDDQTAELTVVAILPPAASQPANAPPSADPPAAAASPLEADRLPNNMIQSDDRLIRELAQGIAAGESDAWKVACALERYVRDAVRNQESLQVFSTAAEVARSREGDCTEHAVLLAALCRARQIPARVAFGLIYLPPTNSFEYHMWNEVWIHGRWVPLDATLGRGGIGADHIKLGDSNLSGGGPMADLIAVIQVFGRLDLELLEAE